MVKIAFHNLGCKVNAYETEQMIRIFSDAGFSVVPFDELADIYLVNTCTVTNIADRKSRQMLHRAKKRNPDALVVAVGCFVEADPRKAAADEAVDLVIGNEQKKDVLEIVTSHFRERDGAAASWAGPVCAEEINSSGTLLHTRAFLKIQDGCNQFCSYCLIPYVRGRIKSRDEDEVLEEAEELASTGHKEIVLTGIHLSSYGRDRNEPDALLGLIRRIAGVQGVERIRLGSLEPRIITEDFARDLAAIPQVCPHFHLSLQSGSDTVLKRMNRHYTCAEYERSCDILRSVFAHPALTTDVIVGFPQETEEEFAETVAFLERIKLYETHIFKYSRRAGTVADRMDGQLTEAVKAVRSDRLLALNKVNSALFRDWYKGRVEEVLLEEKVVRDGTPYLAGYTREYVRAFAPADSAKVGDIVQVRL